MDIRQLRSFLAVLDHGSFSAAADALFTVQSNVSAHVGRLEAELGMSLLDRRTRQLTPAGRSVETRGREILRQISAITDELASLEDRVIGEVACGTTPSIGLWVLPPTLAVATRDLPEVALTIVEGQSGLLVQQLLTGTLDLAITTGAPNPELTSTPLFDEDIVAVVGHEHPLFRQDSVTLDDLARTELLLPLSDNPLYAHIAEAFDRARLPLRVGLEVGSSALVSAMAAAGVGVALVPATASSSGFAPGEAARRPVVGMKPRGVALTMRSGTAPTRATEAVQAILEQTAREAAASMPGCHVTTG